MTPAKLYHPHSTASENVFVMNPHFYMPQLHTHRRIWVYLPANYYREPSKSFPVIYMQDGQNLFDNTTAAFGEWGIDKTLNKMPSKRKKIPIIIAIDNAADNRIDEYAPWKRQEFGRGGHGNQYADFIAHTLKPYIDNHFRTLADRRNTAIMGSSMGGLIALYTGLKHNQLFGKIGCLSPAFWFNREIFEWAKKQHLQPTKICVVGSKTENKVMENDLQTTYWTLRNANIPDHDLTVAIRKRGKHNEKTWGREFKFVYKTLFN